MLQIFPREWKFIDVGGMGIGAYAGRYGVYAVHPSLKNMAYPGNETKEICENADI